MGILCAILGAVGIYFLQAVLYRRFWKKDLAVSVEFGQYAIAEQEEGELLEVIVNQKWLPLPMLRVKFEVDRHLDFMEEGNVAVTDRCYKSDIFSLMMHQKITRRLKYKAKRRGYYGVWKIDIDSTDLFMRDHLAADTVCSTMVYVYPGQVDTRRLLIPFQKMMGEILTRRYIYEDPFEFQGIRPYEPFDNMRDVNWKASARTGELRTNVHGHTVRQEVCLLLNLESETMMEYKQLKEESIRLASSLSRMFIDEGIPVGIESNARDLLDHTPLHLPGGAGERHFINIQEHLARLDLSQTMESFGGFLADRPKEGDTDVLYLLISSSQRTEVQMAFERLAAARTGCMWIIPLFPDMKEKIRTSEKIQVLRWEVDSNG